MVLLQVVKMLQGSIEVTNMGFNLYIVYYMLEHIY